MKHLILKYCKPHHGHGYKNVVSRRKSSLLLLYMYITSSEEHFSDRRFKKMFCFLLFPVLTGLAVQAADSKRLEK